MASQTAQSDPSQANSSVAGWPRWVLLVLLLVALVVRGRAMLFMGDSLNDDPDGYFEVASNIYEVHTISLYELQLGRVASTASRPPLYPLVLSALYYFTNDLPNLFYGFGAMTAHAVGFLHVVLGVATVWGVWRLGQLWGLPSGGSLLAAALVTVDPLLLYQSVHVMTETLAALLAVLALWAITLCARETTIRSSLLAGALLGLCVLCRPTFLVWLVGVALVLPLAASGGRRFARALALVGAAALVLAPWAVRNQIVFGWPVITTTHGGHTLLLANNPRFYEYLRTAPWGSTWDARQFNEQWTRERRLVGTLGGAALDEVADDRRGYRQAWRNISGQPAMFAYACAMRLGWLWGVLPHQTGPDESWARQTARYAVAVWYALELPLAAGGLWFLGRKAARSPWVWGSLLLVSFTAVHAFYWTDLRMRAPLVGVVALLAAQAVGVLASKRRNAKSLPVAA